MPKRTVTTWTCTRCGLDQLLDGGPGVQPNDWVSVYTVRPPLASAGEKGEHRGDLCWKCRSALTYWLAGVTA